jgi:hypothetical protein
MVLPAETPSNVRVIVRIVSITGGRQPLMVGHPLSASSGHLEQQIPMPPGGKNVLENGEAGHDGQG